MKVLLQRVSHASVSVDGEVVGSIGRGLVVLVGVASGDGADEVSYMAEKTVGLRIFPDSDDKFNLSILDIRGELLIVSQFTLLADTKKGRRPSFTGAAPSTKAEAVFDQFVAACAATSLRVATGRFQNHMHLEIHNDGPVTIMLDSREKG